MKSFFILIFLGCLVYYFQGRKNEIKHPPGILVSGNPIQHDLEIPETITNFNGRHIIALANFEITARVLSTERYWFDRGAKISPIDLALGWNKMSDSNVLTQLDINQYGRFYFYSWRKEAPLVENEIISSSSNVHIIPSSEKIKKRILKFKIGEIVHLEGKLVQVEDDDGRMWTSSLSRTDTGDGACELFYVTEIL